LASFKSSLKDPESGKVLSFNDGELIYTASNSYSARVQGRALCHQVGDKWERDSFHEVLSTLKHSADTLQAYNACVKGGSSQDECAGDSLVLKLMRPGQKVNVNELNDESAKALGF
jgi:hypothetical protein